MESSLLRKKLLISLTFISAYFLYASIRIKIKRTSLRSFVYEQLDRIGGPVHLMKRCSALGTVLISIEKGLGPETFEKNAKYLFKTDFGFENVCKTKKIDICNTENCAIVDIKYFILQYFRELEKRGVILRKRSCSIFNTVYDILPDQAELGEDTKEAKELKEGLKTFGMMIGLVIIHRVYLEMKFERHFLHDFWGTEDLLGTLDNLDPEQSKIYRNIRYNYGHKRSKFVPKSQKPFRYENDPDPLAVEYDINSYPFHQAGRQIFIDPYINSRDLIFQGMRKVCSCEYYTCDKYRPYHNEVNLNFITSEICNHNPTFHDIKDNFDNDKNSRLFLRALRYLDTSEAYVVYQKITGFQYIPADGFSQLPKIKVVSGHSDKLFSKPFIVNIEPGINEKELVKRIRDEINN